MDKLLNKKRKKDLIVIAVATMILISMFVLKHYSDKKVWNDGRCRECGTEQTLVDVTVNTTGTGKSTNGFFHHSYIYECENCKKTIEINK